MSAMPSGMTHQPSPITQRTIELGRGDVTAPAQAIHDPIFDFHAPEGRHHVDDRLGCQSRYRRAPNVFDGQQLGDDGDKAVALGAEVCRPLVAVGHDPHRFVDRLPFEFGFGQGGFLCRVTDCPGSRCIRRVADDGCDSFVIEPNRNPSRRDKYGYSVSHHHRSGMIHFKASSSEKFDGERVEGRPSDQRVQKALEVLRSHISIVAEHRRPASSGIADRSDPLASDSSCAPGAAYAGTARAAVR